MFYNGSFHKLYAVTLMQVSGGVNYKNPKNPEPRS